MKTVKMRIICFNDNLKNLENFKMQTSSSWHWHGQVAGGGKDHGEILPGIGGDLSPQPCAKTHPTENQTLEDSWRWQRTQVGRVRGT